MAPQKQDNIRNKNGAEIVVVKDDSFHSEIILQLHKTIFLHTTKIEKIYTVLCVDFQNLIFFSLIYLDKIDKLVLVLKHIFRFNPSFHLTAFMDGWILAAVTNQCRKMVPFLCLQMLLRICSETKLVGSEVSGKVQDDALCDERSS